MRIQFFPEPALEAELNKEAKTKGVSVSTVVVDALNKYYCLVPPNNKTEAAIETEVLDEIATYIADPANANVAFDLNIASATYAQIDMTYKGRPQVVKAKIGKKFNGMVGKAGRFASVEQVFLQNGRPKRTVGNRAALYIVKK